MKKMTRFPKTNLLAETAKKRLVSPSEPQLNCGTYTPQKFIALYVHWPFCLSKCPYCDFNSHVANDVDHKIWQRALLSELEYFAERTAGRLWRRDATQRAPRRLWARDAAQLAQSGRAGQPRRSDQRLRSGLSAAVPRLRRRPDAGRDRDLVPQWQWARGPGGGGSGQIARV